MEHPKDNMEAIGVQLTDEQIEEIEGPHVFELGFPHNFLGSSSGQFVTDVRS